VLRPHQGILLKTLSVTHQQGNIPSAHETSKSYEAEHKAKKTMLCIQCFRSFIILDL
ncbi:hypothetical protein BgiBS90_022514, partial [Biomphalaria glabrata]